MRLLEIQSFKNFIASADTFTSESFKDIVALAIQKDNAFKARFNEVRTRIQDRPKSEFYSWLDKRE